MRPVLSDVRTRRALRVRARARVSGCAVRGALVGALVTGILGMHAIASHGTSVAPMAAAAASSITTSLTGADTPSVDGHRAMDDRAADPALTSEHGSGHEMGAMVMLCVVMLAAAGLTLIILLVLGLLRRVLPAAFHPAAVHTQARPWVRGTGPPPAWQFSVIRC